MSTLTGTLNVASLFVSCVEIHILMQCGTLLHLKSMKELTTAYVEWGGICGTYSSGTKTRQKQQK